MPTARAPIPRAHLAGRRSRRTYPVRGSADSAHQTAADISNDAIRTEHASVTSNVSIPAFLRAAPKATRIALGGGRHVRFGQSPAAVGKPLHETTRLLHPAHLRAGSSTATDANRAARHDCLERRHLDFRRRSIAAGVGFPLGCRLVDDNALGRRGSAKTLGHGRRAMLRSLVSPGRAGLRIPQQYPGAPGKRLLWLADRGLGRLFMALGFPPCCLGCPGGCRASPLLVLRPPEGKGAQACPRPRRVNLRGLYRCVQGGPAITLTRPISAASIPPGRCSPPGSAADGMAKSDIDLLT